MTYDSAAVRQYAQNISSTAASIRALGEGSLNSAQTCVSENLLGNAAGVLATRISSLKADIQQLAESLDGVASKLFSYAAYLEELDRQAKLLINQQ